WAHKDLVDLVVAVHLLNQLRGSSAKWGKRRIRVKRFPMRVCFGAAGMRDEVDESIVPGRIVGRHPIADDIDTVLSLELITFTKNRFESRCFARKRVIDPELEDAIAKGLHGLRAKKIGNKKSPGEKREQRG